MTKKQHWITFILECFIINVGIAFIPMPTIAKIIVCPLIVVLAGLKLMAALEVAKLKVLLDEAKSNYHSALSRGGEVKAELQKLKNALTWADTLSYRGTSDTEDHGYKVHDQVYWTENSDSEAHVYVVEAVNTIDRQLKFFGCDGWYSMDQYTKIVKEPT